MGACRVEQEEAGSLPDVDVDVEPGNLPEYDVQGPDVNVGVTERTVTVPKVVVVQEEETVDVPYIDVSLPNADQVERTITPEVEVPSGGYDLTIQGIYAVNDELWVVSDLEEVDDNAPESTVRVSDRVVLNAPDMSVRHFIIGDRPTGAFNEQFTFISSREEIAPQLSEGRQLYDQANT
ncbi:MAG: hypothetical protein ACTS3T_24100 [Almyronema sp.]